MEEMVEPDRTIMIVSIVGLVIIWGSVAYHKFVQGGSTGANEGSEPAAGAVEADTGVSDSRGNQTTAGPQVERPRKKGKKSAGKKPKRKG